MVLVCLLTFGLSGHRRAAPINPAGRLVLPRRGRHRLLVHVRQAARAAYGDGSWLNLGYQLADVLLVLAALHAARCAEPDAIRSPVGRTLTVVPLTVAAVSAGTAVALTHLPSLRPDGFLAAGALVGAGLMLRQYLITRDRTRLTDQLTAALAEQERLARTDPLTGLPNRRSFHDALHAQAAHAIRHPRPLSLVVLDLDHFKAINDTHGHAAGDTALPQAAAWLRAVTRDDDTVARIGGEEFVWLLPDTDEAGALVLAERLRATLRAHPRAARYGYDAAAHWLHRHRLVLRRRGS